MLVRCRCDPWWRRFFDPDSLWVWKGFSRRWGSLVDRVPCRLRRIAFVGCTIVLATLAWLPAHAMMRTTLGGHAEHLIAYLTTMVVMGLAFPGSPRLAVQGFLLIGYAAILEVGQLLVAGRHASFDDFAFSATGVAIGGLCLWIARARRSAVRDMRG